MDRFESLDAVFDHVWSCVTAGATDPGHAFRTATVGTCNGTRPALRTVVLREADPGDRALSFHTDRDSQKVEDIRRCDRVAWHWWDPGSRHQVRLQGTARIHTEDAVAREMWEEEDPASLAVHARTVPSGAGLDAPDDALSEAVQEEPITREDVASGREHFAVVRTVVDVVDWLHLHPEGHYRAQFQCPPDAPVEGEWVAP
ncbi:MAG: pyridoxamine 5'-phosphate oxidase family protein [Salinibacter sp.]